MAVDLCHFVIFAAVCVFKAEFTVEVIAITETAVFPLDCVVKRSSIKAGLKK